MERMSMHNQPEIFGCSEQQGQRNSKMFYNEAVYFGATYVFHAALQTACQTGAP